MFRIKSFVIILFSLCFSVPSLSFAQFKVEARANWFGFAEEKPVEYYSPMRYNRCEGWFPAFGVTLRPKTVPGISLSVDAGYAVSSKTAQFNAGFEYKLPFTWVQKIGGKYFDDTFTNDDWIIGRLENSFAAFLLREDFNDFFAAKGFTLWAVQDFEDWFHLRLAFWSGEYGTMQKNTDWSLFGGHKKFRENPAVGPGRENKLRLEFIYDKLDNPIFPLQGFYLEGALEKGGGFLGGDFNQTGVFLTAKYFQSSFANQKIVFQSRFGHRNVALFAPQYLLDLGGIGTLRGYRFKEFTDRKNLFLGSVQYYFNGDLLQKLPLQSLPLYSGLGLILFAEIGSVWGENILPDGMADTGSRLWKSDAGFSLSMTGDFLRIDFAKRLDRSTDTWTVTFRILPRW